MGSNSEERNEDEEIKIIEVEAEKLYTEGVEFETGKDNVLIIDRNAFKQSY